MIRVVVAAPSDDWWDTLTDEQQKKYVKEHPNSKYANQSGGNSSGGQASKKSGGIIGWIKDQYRKMADNPDVLKRRLAAKAKDYDREIAKLRSGIYDARDEILKTKGEIEKLEKSNKGGRNDAAIRTKEQHMQDVANYAEQTLTEINTLRKQKQMYLMHVQRISKSVSK